MANCLIKRVKGVIDDDNIPYFEEVSYKLNSDSQNGYLHAVFDGGDINWEASSSVTVNETTGTSGTASEYIHITPGNNVNPIKIKTWPSYNISSYEINGIISAVDISKQRKQGNIIIKPGTVGAVVIDTRHQSYVLEGIQSYPIGLPIPKDLNLKSNFSVNLPNNNLVRLSIGTTDIMDGIAEYIEGGDVTNLLASSLIPYLDTFAFNIITSLYKKLTVSDIEAFGSFVNLKFLSLGLIPIQGDIAEALKPLVNLTTIIFQGESDVYELSTVFNNWKVLGRKNVSVQFYVNGAFCRINNAQPSTTHFYVDFDANGDWTIRYA